MAKRLIAFLRSVLPTDPYQFIFLAGVICLSIVHGVKWWPVSAHPSQDRVASSIGHFLVTAGNVFVFPITFAVPAGWFVCFWPGKHPIRRVLAFVAFPVAVTIVLTVALFLYLAGPASSVLQRTGVNASSKLKWIQAVAFESLGLQITLIGLLLILLFVLRLAFGASRLPLTLSSRRDEDSIEPSSGWHELMLIWFLIALVALLEGAFVITVASCFPALVHKPWFLGGALNVSSILSLAVALLIADPDARKTMRESISVPKYEWTACALFLPVALEALTFLTQIVFERLHWSFQTEDVSVDENQVARLALSFVVLLLPAFCEEVIFRGLLQNRFIRRYGMYRGIFLVCIVWAAFHIHSDFAYKHDAYTQLFERLGGRVLVTLGIGFVLSWLTLQSRTVVPATISHALYNALVFSPIGLFSVGTGPTRTVLWSVAAIILFRFWSVPTESGPEPTPPENISPHSGPAESGPPEFEADPPPITASPPRGPAS